MRNFIVNYKKKSSYGIFSVEAIIVIATLLIFGFYIIKELNIRIMATKEQTVDGIEGHEFGGNANGMQITPALTDEEITEEDTIQ